MTPPGDRPAGGKSGRWVKLAVALVMLYALLLAVAALSETAGLGWFDRAIFK